MKYYGLNELREMFLTFFESKNHLRLKSFSLVPQNDKSLLLINAGMAPLKAYFTGQEVPPAKRITTCQKCIRTGDIENVGKTARHGTFFEMLGNFSFGDYFKNEAIAWSWEFVTEVLEIPKDKLYVTVYKDDEEAAEIWHNEIGVPKDRIFYMGKEDNFWEVGTVGPCGPCSEIYYDRGVEYGCGDPNCAIGCDCDRYLEFWNLVFTQFDKNADGSYTPLGSPNIDTGMGLERLAALMQGVHTLFDVDTIKAIRDKVCELADVKYGEDAKADVSIRVITDHIRSVVFMSSDGIRASNEGRGYVMRRLIRRAIRHGKMLGIAGAFLEPLIKTVIENSKNEYTELAEKEDYILKSLSVEESNFNQTIEQGLNILESYITTLEQTGEKMLDGAACFKLYDTYGFPIDLTYEILAEKGLTLDEDEFKKEMENQRVRARNAQAQTSYMGADETIFNQLPTDIKTEFNGYTQKQLTQPIKFMTTNDKILESASVDDYIYIITGKTPFYAESGGQAGDVGIIVTATGEATVIDTTKVAGGKIAHYAKVTKGHMEKGQDATLTVDDVTRLNTSRNHSATHLLQKALRTVIGSHIEQAGSNVNKDRLRFDYTHFEPLTPTQINQVETLVNEQILQGFNIDILEMSIDEARKMGAMALFGEKYSDKVRVVNMNDYSIELCGGTHIDNTAKIGAFKIISEVGVASGVRRIEALTGMGAIRYFNNVEAELDEISKLVKAKKGEITKKVTTLIKTNKEIEQENSKLKSQLSRFEISDITNETDEKNGVKVLVKQLENKSIDELKQISDTFRDKLGTSVIFLASITDKVNLVCSATKDVSQIHCGKIISKSAMIVDGKGGGRPNMAQAGGKDTTKINDALTFAKKLIIEQL
ncbi:MAG: alanine--tRNA ligase [Epulopiscium sp. Nuni2H_MBin003]|nr:MAG: alanine--tRNA ligase [Epulopiscium sp. Nuni2H_MBin003]